jgi:hypothetical protein
LGAQSRAYLGAGALLALCTSCSIAIPYPSAQPESTPLVCHDGLDQDFDGRADCDDSDCAAACRETVCADGLDDDDDGLVDCVDPDCDGAACPEETLALCDDGRDNDVDGRVDARDAGCWAELAPTLERCASVLGTDATLGVDDFVGGVVEADPIGTGVPMRIVPERTLYTTRLDEPTVTSTTVATGALDGATARVVLYVRTNPTSMIPPLFGVRVSQRGAGRAAARIVQFNDSSGSATFSGDLASMPSIPGGAVPNPEGERLELEFAFTSANVRFTLTGETGDPIVVDAALDESWTDSAALELGVTAAGLGQVWIERATLFAPRLVRCGRPAPPLGVQPAPPFERAGTVLEHVARGPDGVLCGIVAREAGLGAYERLGIVSHDDGATWQVGSPHGTTNSTIALRFASTVAFDSVTGLWHAARVDQVDVGARELSTQRSSDCLTWTALEGADALAPSGPRTTQPLSTVLAYRIDEAGHSIDYLVGIDGDRIALATARSPWGDPGTWTVDDAMTPLDALGVASAAERRTIAARLMDLGARVLIVDGGRLAWVLRADGELDALAPMTAASGEPGAFDALGSLGSGTLIEDESSSSDAVWRGRLFHSGAYDVLPDLGWGADPLVYGALR